MLFKTQLTVMLFVGLAALSNNVLAQSVEKIYAANSCDTGTDDVGQPVGTSGIFYNTFDQSFTRRSTFNNDPTIICPITRQKIGSAAGAKFFVYLTKSNGNGGLACTMTSRRPHNGALVSTGFREVLGATPAGDYRLARSIAPSSTYGHYSLTCNTDGFPAFHSYRIKEF